MSYHTYEIASAFRILPQNVEPAFRKARRDRGVRREIGSDMVDTQVSLFELFGQVGYCTEFTEQEGILRVWSDSDTHYGLDALLFAIAPFVEDDSYIQMTSEDQLSWVWYFQDGQCFELDFTVKTLRDKSLKQLVADCIKARVEWNSEKKPKNTGKKKEKKDAGGL